MNKLTIPALLLGVVMIAGAFAFMPVQEASTVHLSAANTANSMKLFVLVSTCTVTGADADDCEELDIDIPTNAAYRLLSGEMTTVQAAGQTTLDVEYIDCLAGGDENQATGIVLDTAGAQGASTTVVTTDFTATDLVFIGAATTTDINCGSGTIVSTPGATITVKLVFEISGDAEPSITKHDAT